MFGIKRWRSSRFLIAVAIVAAPLFGCEERHPAEVQPQAREGVFEGARSLDHLEPKDKAYTQEFAEYGDEREAPPPGRVSEDGLMQDAVDPAEQAANVLGAPAREAGRERGDETLGRSDAPGAPVRGGQPERSDAPGSAAAPAAGGAAGVAAGEGEADDALVAEDGARAYLPDSGAIRPIGAEVCCAAAEGRCYETTVGQCEEGATSWDGTLSECLARCGR